MAKQSAAWGRFDMKPVRTTVSQPQARQAMTAVVADGLEDHVHGAGGEVAGSGAIGDVAEVGGSDVQGQGGGGCCG